MIMKNVLRKNAFTLIELVLVSGLIAVVGAALFSTLSSGLRVWQRLNSQSTLEDISIFWEELSSDARESFSFSKILFSADRDEVSFPSVISKTGKDGVKKEIGQVKYYLDSSRRVIIREQLDFSQATHERKGLKRSFGRDIEALDFKVLYYNPSSQDFSFTSSWPEGEASFDSKNRPVLPWAVNVKVRVRDGDKRQEFAQTIFIPAGCCQELLPEQ